jgi:adenine-specific DNA-methyltransferase
VYFTYRPLTAEEAASYTGNSKQEAINQATFKAVTERVKETALRGALAAPYTLKEGETAPPTAAPTLLRHLTQFTRKNSADFFIHKNLAGFLSGELDQFLKTECLRLDDLLSGSEGDLALLTARARATKAVGEKVIALLASVEDFQRRLFEKRKFILATEYVFTLDRVPAALHAAVLANAAQVQEWRDLYDVDGLLKADGVLGEGGLTLEALQGAPYNRLPVDTRHFDAAFKTDLLASVDDLDELTDGVLFESENLQALNLLTETYRERVKCVYIDPPYNTGGDGFLYKDAYQHSSWLSMMADRLAAARALLPADGALFVSIDDDEQANLKRLMDSVFGGENFVASVIWQKKYAPANDAKWFSDDHDFLVTYARDKEAWRPTKLARDEEQNKGYKNPDNDARGNWKPDNYISNKTADQRPNLYYPIIQPNTGEEIWPSANAVWRYSRERHAQNVAEGRVWWGKDGTNKVPAYKRFLSEVGDVVPRTIWSYEEVGHNQDAVRELRDMFPATDFTSPKPTTLIRRVAEVNPAAITLDFFAGSGTTGNAIINLIRDAAEGAPRRKYLLVEMGAYFHSVLLPRVKKAVFSSKWSEGKPVAPDPVPQTIKYLALEQYEDTLNNLRLRPEGEAQLAMEVYGEDYLLRYLLEFDTAGSPSLLNVADLADPFRYALRVRSGDDFVHQAVDLPETFTYLLGLQVRKVRAFADGEREYRAVLGTDRNGRATAHVWRRASDLAGDADALKRDAEFVTGTVLPALSDARPDRLYINGAFAGIEGAENCEPDLLRLLFAPVGAA